MVIWYPNGRYYTLGLDRTGRVMEDLKWQSRHLLLTNEQVERIVDWASNYEQKQRLSYRIVAWFKRVFSGSKVITEEGFTLLEIAIILVILGGVGFLVWYAVKLLGILTIAVGG